MKRRLPVAACATVVALAGCGVIPAPPGELENDFIPSVAPVEIDPSSVTSDGFTFEQHVAVRLRVETCDGWSNGSGWILDDSHIITNAHVVEDATKIEVTTYDGRDFLAIDSDIAPTADLAIVTLDSVFDEHATWSTDELDVGDPLTVVGYPEAQSLTVEEGTFDGEDVDDVNFTGEQVWYMNAKSKPGSSGSPVFDETGTVVATLYAGDSKSYSMAWPNSWLEELVDDPDKWQPNLPSC